MTIYKTAIDNQLLVTSKKGFMYIFKGVGTNFPQPLRLLMNLAVEQENGMNELLRHLQNALIAELGIQKLMNLSVRQICEKFEFEDVRKFYWTMTKEQQEDFLNTFGMLQTFKERPIIGFRNSKGIEYQ